MGEQDYEIIARQVNDLSEEVRALKARLAEVEAVNARLEMAAETTGRSMKEISRHWDLVYEALRRGVRYARATPQAERRAPGSASARAFEASRGQHEAGRARCRELANPDLL